MLDYTIKYANDSHVLDMLEMENVPYFSFPLLEQLDMVRHGFSTRLGGVSEGIFSSMNLSFVRGDDYDKVQENYRRIASAIGVEKEKIICSKQTHTTNVLVVNETHAGNGVITENVLEDIDGMITNVPGLCIATFYADCVPLYFVDPVKKAIGLSHSGWKGTVHKMGAVTIEKMVATYGCDPTDIRVAIGPSICQDCYEVSEDVIEKFREFYSEKYWNELFYRKGDGKYQLNLWKANEIVLLESGILREHIAVTNVCTCCNSDLLFSHRASKGKRGNLGAFLSLTQ
ncbi:MAG: peptidoglycan editing factor PgeF [Eubacteriales bacterium]